MRNSKSFDVSQGASNTNAHLGYLPQLDGLRVLAVGMVMMGHWWQWKWTQPILKGLPLVHGVTLFFVLSGYLITRILLQENQIRIHNGQGYLPFMVRFYVRRTLRIFPLYYMVIFSLFLIDYPNARELFPWLLSYTTNIYQSIHNTYVGDFNHFWSLGVEEQFYLFWPWLLLAFPRSKSLIWAMLGIAVLGMGTRIYLAVEVGKWMATSYFTLSCMPILAMGGILAWIQRYRPTFALRLGRGSWLLVFFFLYLAGLLLQIKFQWGWYKELVDEYFFALLSMLLIAKASMHGFKGWSGKILMTRGIRYTGQISYGLYVFHLFIPNLTHWITSRLNLHLGEAATLVLYFVLTFGMAHASWVLIERPINRIKHRFPYLKA